MHGIRPCCDRDCVTQFAEYLEHRRVARQYVGLQFLQARGACDSEQMFKQEACDAQPLVGIDHAERDLGVSGPGDDVTPTADQQWPALLFEDRDQRDMVDHVHFGEIRDLAFAESGLEAKKTLVTRLFAHTANGLQHGRTIIGLGCAYFEPATVAQCFEHRVA
jgi:hypothetical protein